MKRILAFLQNQYFHDPDKVRGIFERRPDLRNDLIARFLFMGGRTGKRILAAFGDDLCKRIIWEEASPEIGGHASSVFKADLDHMKRAIETHRPVVIVCFGQIAGDAVKLLKPETATLFAPHPAARGRDVKPKLKEAALKLTEIVMNGEEVDQDALTWLIRVPATDTNFVHRLKSANPATVRAALEEVNQRGGQKTKVRKLESKLRSMAKEINSASG